MGSRPTWGHLSWVGPTRKPTSTKNKKKNKKKKERKDHRPHKQAQWHSLPPRPLLKSPRKACWLEMGGGAVEVGLWGPLPWAPPTKTNMRVPTHSPPRPSKESNRSRRIQSRTNFLKKHTTYLSRWRHVTGSSKPPALLTWRGPHVLVRYTSARRSDFGWLCRNMYYSLKSNYENATSVWPNRAITTVRWAGSVAFEIRSRGPLNLS